MTISAQPVNLIGRDSELETMRDHVRLGKNLAVVGPEGVGKTAMVTQAIAGLPDVLYCADTGTPKTACECLMTVLGESLAASNNIQRKRVVLAALRKHHCCIVFDHVPRVSPKLLSLLENLRESHPLVVVTRSLAWNDIGHLRMILWDFDTLELGGLRETAARRLVRAESHRLGLTVPDAQQFEHDVWRLSRGNPRALIALCEQAKRSRYVFGRRVNMRLLDLDRRITEWNTP